MNLITKLGYKLIRSGRSAANQLVIPSAAALLSTSFVPTVTVAAAPVTIPSPTTYYTFNSNGNDNCPSPLNFDSYSSNAGGKIGNCTALNGTATTGSGTKLDPDGTGFTWAGWFYRAAGTQITTVSIRRTSATFVNLSFAFTNTPSTVVIYNNGSKGGEYSKTVTTNQPAANTWFFFHIRYSAGALRFSWNNGTEETLTCPSTDLGGAADMRTTLQSGCRVDELAFWKGTVLTPTEIAAVYKDGEGRTFNGTTWSS